MEKEIIEQYNEYISALREKRILLVVDSKSKAEKCVFSLVHYDLQNKRYYDFSNLLSAIGMKQDKTWDDLFIAYCSGRYALYVFYVIGQHLKSFGFNLPDDYWDIIQSQSAI